MMMKKKIKQFYNHFYELGLIGMSLIMLAWFIIIVSTFFFILFIVAIFMHSISVMIAGLFFTVTGIGLAILCFKYAYDDI